MLVGLPPFYDKNMEVYVETFGGMFWCFFNMDLKQFPNLKKVVYNETSLFKLGF